MWLVSAFGALKTVAELAATSRPDLVGSSMTTTNIGSERCGVGIRTRERRALSLLQLARLCAKLFPFPSQESEDDLIRRPSADEEVLAQDALVLKAERGE